MKNDDQKKEGGLLRGRTTTRGREEGFFPRHPDGRLLGKKSDRCRRSQKEAPVRRKKGPFLRWCV